MKKHLLAASILGASLLASSCSVSSVCVGDLKVDDPVTRVKTVHNSFFVGGLLGRKKIDANDYVMGNDNYMVKNYRSFVDCVIGSVTLGIYTPSTTEIYLPSNYKMKEKKQQ